jgi:predicted DNA-binding WGR domain protein
MTNTFRNKPVYWECSNDEHSKFWAARIIDNLEIDQNNDELPHKRYSLIRRWGIIGTIGQIMTQEYDNLYEAERELERLIWEKEIKGYKAIF